MAYIDVKEKLIEELSRCGVSKNQSYLGIVADSLIRAGLIADSTTVSELLQAKDLHIRTLELLAGAATAEEIREIIAPLKRTQVYREYKDDIILLLEEQVRELDQELKEIRKDNKQ